MALVWLALAALPSGAAAEATVLAEPPPEASEGVTTGSPALAATPRAGGWLLVYESPVGDGPDGRRHEIRARRIDAAGGPVSDPVVVGEPAAGTSAVAPRLAYDPDGERFLVVWRELRGIIGDGRENAGRVRARALTTDGVPTSAAVTLAPLAQRLTGAEVEYHRWSRRWAVAWTSRDGVRARLVGGGARKVGGTRALGAETNASEVTVGATRGAFLVAWVHPAGRRFSAVSARPLSAESGAAGRRTRIPLDRPPRATAFLVSDLDLAYDSRRRQLALAYSSWWDSRSLGDTEVDVQRLTPRGARIGAPVELDVELNSENLSQSRLSYDRVSDAYRAVWTYDEIPSGPLCRVAAIRTRAISGAWKLEPAENNISRETDPGGPPRPNGGGDQCRVPPEAPAIAPGRNGWLAAWSRNPYVLGLRLAP